MTATIQPPPRALTIAGSDPSGGAGLQLDIAVFTRLGVHPMAIPTALTVQNSTGVSEVTALDAEGVEQSLRAITGDMPPRAAKTGMLGNRAVVEAIARVTAGWPVPYLVIDPVQRASSGPTLSDDGATGAMAKLLFPHAALITPNRYEAEQLWGRPVRSPEDAVRCARELREMGPRAVLITGGHLEDKGIVDTLADEGGVTTWRHPRHPGPSPHGTGCALSAAITAHLALGRPLRESVRQALVYVIHAIASATTPGSGRPYLGDGEGVSPILDEAPIP